jgi:L-fuculokinase
MFPPPPLVELAGNRETELMSAKQPEPFTLVLDVGKTNVKLLLMSKAGSIRDTARIANRSLDGPPYPHLDTEHIWQWMLDALRDFAKRFSIDAIVTTTHGCAAALVDDEALVLPPLDYEVEVPQHIADAFEAVTPPFDRTKSPPLPQGMNLGRQLFRLQQEFPDQFARARHILCYPQYWAWRLCGVPAAEITSIACHSHLWEPREHRYSSLVRLQGWEALLAPMRPAFDGLGPVRPQIARQTGLAPTCLVYNGIHDSNAAYSLYLRGHQRPFSLVSTGTWIIIFSPRMDLDGLQENTDTLAMVNVTGDPVPVARYMGGREFELLTADCGPAGDCTEQDLERVIARGCFLLPSYAPGGPFAGRRGTTVGPHLDKPGEILARATLYVALVTTRSMILMQTDGDLMIDGGFVNNTLYCRLLATLGRSERCFVNHETEGTAVGAGMLAVWREQGIHWPLNLKPVEKLQTPGLESYAARWRELVADG